MRNIVLVTVDCLRYDRCGFNNYNRNTTPVIDDLVNESLIFDQAFSTGPYTTESIPGIIAGQHSHNGYAFGDTPAWKAISRSDLTLASYLSAEGYETGAVISNPHLTSRRNFNRGFDEFTNLREDKDGGHADNNNADFSNLMYSIRERMRKNNRISYLDLLYSGYRYSQYRSNWPTQRAKDVLSKFKQIISQFNSPFFGWTHLMDLHAPINPKSVLNGKLNPPNTRKTLLSDASRASRRYSSTYSNCYDNALNYIDSQLGEFINFLKKNNQWDNTIFILTADHGEALFDREKIYGHPRHYHYDDLLHVPLLVRIPDKKGQRINSHFSLSWIHELISELVKIEQGNFPTKSGRSNVTTESSGYVMSDTLDERGHTISIRNSTRKLISHKPAESVKINWEYSKRNIVYNYRQDPSERNPSNSSGNDTLLNECSKYITDPNEIPFIGEGLDEKLESHLKDLGYKM